SVRWRKFLIISIFEHWIYKQTSQNHNPRNVWFNAKVSFVIILSKGTRTCMITQFREQKLENITMNRKDDDDYDGYGQSPFSSSSSSMNRII
ncbi:hypothetical protein BLOT_003368, partial [Blomia tropicalis]